jgi:hypothetical protein
VLRDDLMLGTTFVSGGSSVIQKRHSLLQWRLQELSTGERPHGVGHSC